MEGGLRLSRHDEGEYAYLWRSFVIATGKDNVAVAFSRHVLTPPVLSADVYRRMVAVWHWLLCGWQFQQILVDSGQSVTYSVARVYPSSVRLLEGRWWITCSLRRVLYVQRIQARISLRLARIAPLTRVNGHFLFLLSSDLAWSADLWLWQWHCHPHCCFVRNWLPWCLIVWSVATDTLCCMYVPLSPSSLRQYRFWGPPSLLRSLYWGHFPRGYIGWKVKLTTQPCIAPWLRMHL